MQDAPNGFPLFPDYKNWKAISSTDRIDTNTQRLIVRNDIAIKAIADNKGDPWPNSDGNTSLCYSRHTNRHRRTIMELPHFFDRGCWSTPF